MPHDLVVHEHLGQRSGVLRECSALLAGERGGCGEPPQPVSEPVLDEYGEAFQLRFLEGFCEGDGGGDRSAERE